MKKILYGFISLFAITPILGISTSFTHAQECSGFWCTNYVSEIKVPWASEWKTDASLLDSIKDTINWILGILATVALVICLYAGFKMLTSWWDSKWYEAGLKILKNAALWLAIIGLSWLIVSAIFWFVNLQTKWSSNLPWAPAIKAGTGTN